MTLKLNWPTQTVYQHIVNYYPLIHVEVIQTIDSTNSELMRRLKLGKTTPTLLIAEEQTAARGRMGKHWETNLGASLMFSVLLPISTQTLDGLSLVIGCAVNKALMTAQEEMNKNENKANSPLIKLKWPNDVWLKLNDHEGASWSKLAGILIEATTINKQLYVVIGVGVNISTRATKTDHAIPAGALQQINGNWDAQKAFAFIAPQIVEAVYNFNNQGLEPWRAFYAQHDLLLNHPLHTSDGVQGIGAGINHQGHLLIKTDKELIAIHSGEISVRPC